MLVLPKCQPSTSVMEDWKAYFFLPLYEMMRASQQ